MSGKVCSSVSVAQARRAVEQLRVEAGLDRMQVSVTGRDLVQFCQQHSRSDALLSGVPASANPFKDKKPCVLL
ncbi:guanine nucleotide-binding protein G(I)/G(S)/G(O) subunit gamma-7-like [Amia ocellicauda]|uniref:guanine nucleotide-binding protein G(I)/G(S)/G(O) subunit gamma-7-like n=1 Tax=Amia ocellicauda TaxID=2972642 RepID=UPI0034648D62|nr:GBG7 protein [Amia calva]